jgi:hypothetical protein
MEHDEKRMRRQIANSNERRRMQSINAGFQSLRQLLPHHEGEKLSKVRGSIIIVHKSFDLFVWFIIIAPLLNCLWMYTRTTPEKQFSPEFDSHFPFLLKNNVGRARQRERRSGKTSAVYLAYILSFCMGWKNKQSPSMTQSWTLDNFRLYAERLAVVKKENLEKQHKATYFPVLCCCFVQLKESTGE